MGERGREGGARERVCGGWVGRGTVDGRRRGRGVRDEGVEGKGGQLMHTLHERERERERERRRVGGLRKSFFTPTSHAHTHTHTHASTRARARALLFCFTRL